MRLDPGEIAQQDAYKILIGCVVPRPIAWVSTVDATGVRNLAPYSFFNAVGSNPLALSVSIIHNAASTDNRKDTLRNIETTGQFVVNLVNERLAEAMNATSADFPSDMDEFTAVGLEAAPSELVRPPRVAEATVSFECERYTTLQVGEGVGSATLVVGRILLAHIHDDLIDERFRIDLHKLQPIARLAGNDYAFVRETFSMTRPRYNRETGTLE